MSTAQKNARACAMTGVSDRLNRDELRLLCEFCFKKGEEKVCFKWNRICGKFEPCGGIHAAELTNEELPLFLRTLWSNTKCVEEFKERFQNLSIVGGFPDSDDVVTMDTVMDVLKKENPELDLDKVESLLWFLRWN